MRALDREPLSAEALARAYGPTSAIGPELVGALYRRLAATDHPLVDTLFREWDRIFGIVYGQDTARAAQSAAVLGRLYGVPSPDLKRLFFAVHTDYALVMKLLAVEVASLQQGTYITSFVDEVEGLDDAAFDRKLAALEDGSEFRRLEITNYLEGDFFGWYLSAWDERAAHPRAHLCPYAGGVRAEQRGDRTRTRPRYPEAPLSVPGAQRAAARSRRVLHPRLAGRLPAR